MNCASVTITGGGGRESVPFRERPEILRAHAGTDCGIKEGFDVDYPDPGPDVTVAPNAKLIAPEGSECGSVGPRGGSGGSVSPLFPGPPGGAGGAGGSMGNSNLDFGGYGYSGGNVPTPDFRIECMIIAFVVVTLWMMF